MGMEQDRGSVEQHICAMPRHSPDEFITAGNEDSSRIRSRSRRQSRSQHNHNSCRCLLNWFSFCQLGISIVAKGQSDDTGRLEGGRKDKKNASISIK